MRFFVTFILGSLILLSFTAFGQTNRTNSNSIQKVYLIKLGKKVFIQKLQDAPREVRKYKLLDLNDSIIILRKDRKTILVIPTSEIVGFWIIDSRAKIKMLTKTTLGLTWFFVGLGLFLSAADYQEGYFKPYFLNQTVHVAAAVGGLYMVVKSNAKANATKVDLHRDQFIIQSNE
jgi:hypothetical protein